MKRMMLALAILLQFSALCFFVPAAQAAEQLCFTETSYCIDGRIREFWQQNGGLAVFGFPIGNPEQISVDGKTITAQRFERNRLELHPENARPYDVLLGRLGVDRLTQQGRDWFTFPKSSDTGGCRVFAETGHAVCGEILGAWRKNGIQLDTKAAISEAESLALFGLPISGLVSETLSDGRQYQVQWFERARIELHPENSAPYNILLGLLGNEVTAPPGVTPVAVAAPQPAVTGPGSAFVPLPQRMFASYMLEQIGYSNIDMETQWTVTSDYAAGLATANSLIRPSEELVDGLVQSLSVGSRMTSPSGNLWAAQYSINEFSNDTDAFIWYYDLDAIGLFTEDSSGVRYGAPSGCWVRYSMGTTTSNVLGVRMVMNCENKVMTLSVFGYGTSDEFVQLVITIQSFFSNSFRW